MTANAKVPTTERNRGRPERSQQLPAKATKNYDPKKNSKNGQQQQSQPPTERSASNNSHNQQQQERPTTTVPTSNNESGQQQQQARSKNGFVRSTRDRLRWGWGNSTSFVNNSGVMAMCFLGEGLAPQNFLHVLDIYLLPIPYSSSGLIVKLRGIGVLKIKGNT